MPTPDQLLTVPDLSFWSYKFNDDDEKKATSAPDADRFVLLFANKCFAEVVVPESIVNVEEKRKMEKAFDGKMAFATRSPPLRLVPRLRTENDSQLLLGPNSEDRERSIRLSAGFTRFASDRTRSLVRCGQELVHLNYRRWTTTQILAKGAGTVTALPSSNPGLAYLRLHADKEVQRPPTVSGDEDDSSASPLISENAPLAPNKLLGYTISTYDIDQVRACLFVSGCQPSWRQNKMLNEAAFRLLGRIFVIVGDEKGIRAHAAVLLPP